MLRILAPLAVLLALLAWSLSSSRVRARSDLVFDNGRDCTTLDFAQMSWSHDLRLSRMLFQALTEYDVLSADFRVRPAAAERWEISPDKRTYTFHLRQNAKWSNGAPVRAEDFRYSWRRSLLPDSAADYVKFFTLIEGGQAFYDWRTAQLAEFAKREGLSQGARRAEAERMWTETLARFDQGVAIRCPDDHTLVVTLERPTPYFLELTAFATLSPVYPPLVRAYEYLDESTGMMKTRQDWTKPPNLVSNGAFYLAEWRFKRDMLFLRNPHYWDAKNVNLDSITIPSIDDQNAKVLAFRTGSADLLMDVVAPYRSEMLAQKRAFYAEHQDEYDRLKAEGWDAIEIDRRLPRDPRNMVHAFPAFGNYFYNIMCTPTLRDGRTNPFADPRVRRAFALAVDKRAIVEQIRRVGEPVASTFIPVGAIPGYTSPKGLGFDPAEARRLLAEAGFPDGKGMIPVEILFNKDSGHDLIAQSVAKDWQKHLGVQVRLEIKELKAFRDDLRNSNFMISRGSWFGDYGDPTTFLDINRVGDGNNDRKYESARFEALMDQAAAETDDAKRMAILTEAERVLVEEDLPLIPFFTYVQVLQFDPHKVSGITSHPRQVQNLDIVDMLGDGKGGERAMVMERRRR